MSNARSRDWQPHQNPVPATSPLPWQERAAMWLDDYAREVRERGRDEMGVAGGKQWAAACHDATVLREAANLLRKSIGVPDERPRTREVFEALDDHESRIRKVEERMRHLGKRVK